ncbi:SDR family NAD(P)-dependent oxidoreductase [Sandaracinobacteroides saxicola]|uniref:SDR family oxidoreductase n=1 Tax=Sandaracinobacteroides saxicola TaxID=2759707 RepID=A0A7G5IGU0_9SPHN|nr:SDR family oxidoreductase [Sandaracinobacteroides saxicola]QMW22582.1 SDR family oxidoreductase [Sandaracinobacteroides saxicola]
MKGKVALVLGAAGAGNMGQVIARRLAGAGARVWVAGRRLEPLQALAAAIGGVAARCDITVKAEVEALAADMLAAEGRVDVAVNATGWGLMKGLHEVTEDELDAMCALQFKGVHHFLSAFVRAMPHGGSIIQVSSATTQVPIFDHAAYIGTKAGSEALVRAVANQYGSQGLRVNCVSPGLTASPMTADAMAAPGLEAAFAKEYPLGRIGTSEDIADAVLWLAGDGAFVTGQNIQVNGGLTLRRNPRPEEIGAAIAAAMGQ